MVSGVGGGAGRPAPTRSPELEVELELEDVDQMIAAQDERRCASGRPEISEDEIRAQVEVEERAHAERARRHEED